LAATVVTGAYQADQQQKQGKANAQIAENNAVLAQQDADASNALATREMEQQSWRTRIALGQQRAAIAANKLDPTLGTPAEILGETAMFGGPEPADAGRAGPLERQRSGDRHDPGLARQRREHGHWRHEPGGRCWQRWEPVIPGQQHHHAQQRAHFARLGAVTWQP